jgi:hypothetical protein
MNLFRDGATRRRRTAPTALAVLALALVLPLGAGGTVARQTAQATVPLGNAATFGAVSSTAMTNAGLDTVVTGNVGSSTSVDAGVTHPGFGGYVAPAIPLTNAQASVLIAYGNAEAQTPTGDITGANLAGKTLMAGVYNSTGSILISGPTALTLDGNGNADSVFIFQASSSGDLTVDPTSRVTYTNGAQPCNVFWKVHSAFLKNTGSTFVGTILALTQITLTDSITLEGRALAQTADVTFIHDVVNVPTACVTQASVDAAAAAAAQAAANAAAATAAANAAAQAAADAAAAKVATEAAAAKVAADVAAKAAADARAAAAAAKKAAAAADVAAAKAAAAKAARAAKIAKTKAATAKAAAAKAVAVKAAKGKATSTNRTLAKPPIRHVGLTG